MKTDFYTKTVLTIIAVALVAMVLQHISIIPEAKAASLSSNYAMIPVNSDGSINVKTEGTVDVNIDEVGSYSCYNKLPVVIKENEDK